MSTTETTIKTADNFELNVLISAPEGNAKKTVVMCHGLTSYKEGRRGQLTTVAKALCDDGYKVIQFDFRGHGKSSGTDLDVRPTTLEEDLKTVIDNFVKDEDYYLFGFSFGGFTVCKYLYDTKNTSVKKVALIGPPLDPINSSLLNPKEFCYPEIHEAIISGSLEKDGYAYWSSKDFRVSKKFIEECREFNFKEAITCLVGRTLLLQGTNDKNVDRDYNKRFAEEYNIEYKEYDASHSLWEVIDEAAKEIVEFYNK